MSYVLRTNVTVISYESDAVKINLLTIYLHGRRNRGYKWNLQHNSSNRVEPPPSPWYLAACFVNPFLKKK